MAGMRIEQLTLPTADVAATAAYFADVLQLPVHDATVTLGWSQIHLIPAGTLPVGGVHLAFNVPHNRFAAATAWLDARATRQRNAEGQEHFTFEGRWDSESIYFTAPMSSSSNSSPAVACPRRSAPARSTAAR